MSLWARSINSKLVAAAAAAHTCICSTVETPPNHTHTPSSVVQAASNSMKGYNTGDTTGRAAANWPSHRGK